MDPKQMMEMIKLMGMGGQPAGGMPPTQGVDIAGILKQLSAGSPTEQAHQNWVAGGLPSYTGNQSNPFNSGFFNDSAAKLTPEARLASQGGSAATQWAQLGQTPGVNGDVLTQLLQGRSTNVNPDAQARWPVGQVLPEPQQPDMGFNPTTRGIPGGFEGMINPMAPGNQRFQDSNFFTALPGQSTGADINGTPAPKKKKKPTGALGNPMPGFSFGAGVR